ncbi:MAG: EthD family reductase [Rhizobiaceae bacterium]
MHCLTVIYPRPDDEAAFRSYYEQNHVPLAARLPGLKRMHFAYPEAVSPGDVFCIFQGYFDDGSAMGSAMQSEIGRQVAADVPNYSPKGAQIVHFPVEA